MPNPENLYKFRWPKGTSGNLKGKPKGTISIKTRLEHMMDRPMELTNLITGAVESGTFREFFERAVMIQCALGNGYLISDVWDRMYGKPSQEIITTTGNSMQALSPDDLKALIEAIKKKKA